MERNITITLDKAIEWYNGDNETLKELALEAFTKKELYSFRNIKTFEDACNILGLNFYNMTNIAYSIDKISKASRAMFQLNIIRKALNLGQELHLAKNPKGSYVYCPYVPFVTQKSSNHYREQINSGELSIIGSFTCEGQRYYAVGGGADCSGPSVAGIGRFNSNYEVGWSGGNYDMFGCANKEIAEHFGRYFGMLIIEAEYGDLDGFKMSL